MWFIQAEQQLLTAEKNTFVPQAGKAWRSMANSLRDPTVVPASYIATEGVAHFKAENQLKNSVYKAAAKDHPKAPTGDTVSVCEL